MAEKMMNDKLKIKAHHDLLLENAKQKSYIKEKMAED